MHKKNGQISINGLTYALPKKDPGLGANFVPAWRERLGWIGYVLFALVLLRLSRVLREMISPNIPWIEAVVSGIVVVVAFTLIFLPSVIDRIRSRWGEKVKRVVAGHEITIGAVRLTSKTGDFPVIQDNGIIELREGALFYTGEVFDCVIPSRIISEIKAENEFRLRIDLKSPRFDTPQTVYISSQNPIDLEGNPVSKLAILLTTDGGRSVSAIRPPFVLYPCLSAGHLRLHKFGARYFSLLLLLDVFFVSYLVSNPSMARSTFELLWAISAFVGLAAVVGLYCCIREKSERSKALLAGVPKSIVYPVRIEEPEKWEDQKILL